MAETIQFNVNVKPETNQMVEEISAATMWRKGVVIDWLVACAYEQMQANRLDKTTLAEALNQPYPRPLNKPTEAEKKRTVEELIHRLGGDQD